MSREIPEHIYCKNDIDKAFDMGVEIAVSLFEKTVGMSQEKQMILIQKIKDMLMENKVVIAMSKP